MSYIMALKINKDVEIGDSGIKLKDLFDGTGILLQGKNNCMRIFRDADAWLPTAFQNGEYQKVLCFIHPVGQQGEFGIAVKDGLAYPFTDGVFYQRESGYRVLDESDLGNYNFYKFPRFDINASTPVKEASLGITSKGRPVFVSITGDLNSRNSTGSWIRITLIRDNTYLATQIAQGTSDSQNIPFAINFLDRVDAGNHTYKVVFERGGNDSQFGEENDYGTPNFIVYEI